MTIEQAKEIVKIAPTSQEERIRYLEALRILGSSWANPAN